MAYKWQDHIVRDTAICGGLPTMRGTRVLLRQVLADVADGMTVEQIIDAYPSLKPDHVKATIAFAAHSAKDDLPEFGFPAE